MRLNRQAQLLTADPAGRDFSAHPNKANHLATGITQGCYEGFKQGLAAIGGDPLLVALGLAKQLAPSF